MITGLMTAADPAPSLHVCTTIPQWTDEVRSANDPNSRMARASSFSSSVQRRCTLEQADQTVSNQLWLFCTHELNTMTISGEKKYAISEENFWKGFKKLTLKDIKLRFETNKGKQYGINLRTDALYFGIMQI
ncbi:hypothetical protein TNIN_495421 [Trichonephila inaurata madagascariensis]|uniref:Uncharacterized protein n=1 Tax=Trichonephila inaurata madagascariensis TaxID=2747483 RepID=A0A8X6YMY6_9ARAC|nr:hypothetical protein TNIN_495421 [Trichonephila inaurata madagascariensis]